MPRRDECLYVQGQGGFGKAPGCCCSSFKCILALPVHAVFSGVSYAKGSLFPVSRSLLMQRLGLFGMAVTVIARVRLRFYRSCEDRIDAEMLGSYVSQCRRPDDDPFSLLLGRRYWDTGFAD